MAARDTPSRSVRCYSCIIFQTCRRPLQSTPILDLLAFARFVAQSKSVKLMYSEIGTEGLISRGFLKTHIDAITSRKLSFTRRSAGLPFCILSSCQALSSFDPKALRDGITKILEISTDTDTSIESKIHCLNSLNILHTDASISSKVISSFVERSYDLAIQSFVSSDWRIRNGALILFSGLTNRVFGSRSLGLDRSHQLLSKRETVTGQWSLISSEISLLRVDDVLFYHLT